MDLILLRNARTLCCGTGLPTPALHSGIPYWVAGRETGCRAVRQKPPVSSRAS